MAADGTISDRPSEVLAADLREEGDGRDLALAKVVAALIGVPSDEVFRRAERERKRQARIRNAVAALFLMVLGAGGYFGWQSRQQQAVLLNTAAECASRLPANQAAASPLNALEACVRALDSYVKGGRHRQNQASSEGLSRHRRHGGLRRPQEGAGVLCQGRQARSRQR